jgi:hypothetical protein
MYYAELCRCAQLNWRVFMLKRSFFNNINRLLGTRIRVICASKVAELSYKSMPFV